MLLALWCRFTDLHVEMSNLGAVSGKPSVHFGVPYALDTHGMGFMYAHVHLFAWHASPLPGCHMCKCAVNMRMWVMQPFLTLPIMTK